MTDRYNEGKALDAVLRFIEARDHAPRENDGRSPDDLNDPDEQRRVDYVCTVGQTLYAFEHTGIEPFIDQIESGVHDKKFFDPIIECFNHRADQEIWHLYVPVGASAGLTGRKGIQVQDALIKWIEKNRGRIPVAPYYDQPTYPPLAESAFGVPFPFSLRRTTSPMSNSPLNDRFFLGPIAPDNLEQQRGRLGCGRPRGVASSVSERVRAKASGRGATGGSP
jgi:hypothetical protein